jgi:hypothetical protein
VVNRAKQPGLNDEEILEYTDRKIGSQALSPPELGYTLSKTGCHWIIDRKYDAQIYGL